MAAVPSATELTTMTTTVVTRATTTTIVKTTTSTTIRFTLSWLLRVVPGEIKNNDAGFSVDRQIQSSVSSELKVLSLHYVSV